jgi:hypothetical protein
VLSRLNRLIRRYGPVSSCLELIGQQSTLQGAAVHAALMVYEPGERNTALPTVELKEKVTLTPPSMGPFWHISLFSCYEEQRLVTIA